MKRALSQVAADIVIGFPLIALLAACSAPVAVVDGKKAIEATAEWKTAQAEAQALRSTRQADIDAARAAAKLADTGHAPSADLDAARKKADELPAAVDAEVKQRLDAATNRIGGELAAFLPDFVRERHLHDVAYAGNFAYVDPASDVTTALAAAFDADRVRRAGLADTDARVKELTAKLAALEARQNQQATVAKK